MRRLAAISAICMSLVVTPAWSQMRGSSRGFAHPVGRASFSRRGHVSFRSGFNGNFRFRSGFHRNHFFGRRFFYPYAGYYSGVYGGYSYPVVAEAPATDYYDDDRAEIAREVNRLSDEVESLRDELQARSRPQRQEESRAVVDSNSPTMLVFKDKHKQEVKNYAIVGQTLWVFNEQRATKFAMASLDVEATRKVNDERGVDFHLPE